MIISIPVDDYTQQWLNLTAYKSPGEVALSWGYSLPCFCGADRSCLYFACLMYEPTTYVTINSSNATAGTFIILQEVELYGGKEM